MMHDLRCKPRSKSRLHLGRGFLGIEVSSQRKSPASVPREQCFNFQTHAKVLSEGDPPQRSALAEK